MVRVGLLGAGFMGRMHASCYTSIPNAQLVAIADMRKEDAEELAELHGAKVYKSANSLLRCDDIDMVDICLPTYMHGKYVIKAAKLGLNVLCEKPMSHKLREAKRMVTAVRENGIKFMCAHVIRFWPEYQMLKKIKDEGTLGKLRVLSLTRVSPMPTWTWDDWILKGELSGGAHADLHVHDTDFVRYLCGEPQKVESVGAMSSTRGMDHMFSAYIYPDMAVVAEGGWGMPSAFPFEMAYRAVFEQGTLTFSTSDSPSVVLYREDGSVEHPEVPKVGAGSSEGAGNITDLGGYFNEIEYFVNCVENGCEPEVVTVEDSCKSVELLTAELKSAKKKLK